MPLPFLRAAVPVALATLCAITSVAARADEPPTPSPSAPEKAPSVPEKPAAEAGVAFDRDLSFDQGVAKGKADGKAVFIDFWRDH